MPTMNDPPRRMGRMIPAIQGEEVAANRSWGAFNGIAPSIITEVRPDGTFMTEAGGPFPTTGVGSDVNVGDIVQIGWSGGEPRAILAHTAKKAQGITPPPPDAPIVEMLLAAPVGPFAPGHGLDTIDVWFRNAAQTTLLNVRDQIVAAGFTIQTDTLTLVPNAWSQDHRSFLVQFQNQGNFHLIIAVFTFDGDEQTPITDTASATLNRIIDLTAQTIAIGVVSWDENVTGGSHVTTAINLGGAVAGYTISVGGPLIVQTVAASIQNAVLTRDDHLVLALTLTVTNRPAGGSVSAVFNYPYLIDVTLGTVLFNGIAQQGTWPTAIYNGAAFVASGPGFFDTTITGTNAWVGGAQFYMVPSAAENYQRVFIGLRAFYFGGNPSLGGTVQQALFVKDLTTGIGLSSVFPLTTYPSGEGSHFVLLSSNQRYAVWVRVAGIPPSGVSNPSAFFAPVSNTLAGYNFGEGLHITDFGPTEVLAIVDAIPLTVQADIMAFLDSLPFLQTPSLLWSDYNDIRTTSDDGRTAPQFVVFRDAVNDLVIVPFVLPLDAFGDIDQEISTMLTLSPDDEQFIADFVTFEGNVSGHQDPMARYLNFSSPNSLFLCVQTLPIDGVGLPGA